MLQQTRIATAKPYYAAFLDRFPDLRSLAAANPDRVLAAWSGLGYYRRARQLHEAARLVLRDHGGRVPDDPEIFARLPGVGRYTTGAVFSIAFDHPLPALDGNVARVLSRLYALKVSVRDPRGARTLWALAGSLVPMRDPGDWNQALMELGATVCVPRGPDCASCPVRRWCRALATDRVAAFPPVTVRRPAERLRRAVVVIERGGRVLMTRRSGPLLEGLWEPPGVDLRRGEPARPALWRALRRLGVKGTIEPTGTVVKHAITHRAIEVEVWRGRATGRVAAGPAAWRDETHPLTALAKRLLRDGA